MLFSSVAGWLLAAVLGPFALLADMADGRVYNFLVGLCQMPLEVLVDAQREVVNYKGCGMSVMEMSHCFKNVMQTKFTTIPDMMTWTLDQLPLWAG
mmetsp:Transcript_68300/g.134979  ORF Transcript_68300/g.134979 Transcript_68300/m.134979 type:complete len:96 (-) Transcript_68300:140-427(-)